MVSLRVHGGPDASGPVLHDFSTNANACGPCPAALEAVHGADAARYPDPAYTGLREALAAFHGVAAERIVVAASASEFIFRATAWAARQGWRSIRWPRPGYGDYAAAAAAHGLQFEEGAPFAWACEPSSPLGTEDDLATTQGVVAVDLAYEPLRVSGRPSDWSGCWQLWSPNKALGLTGVRAAYAVVPAGVAPELEALAPSWPVGAHGVALLQAWCKPQVQGWLAESLVTLREWKARQVGVCEAMGCTVLPSQANFFVCQVGPDLRVIAEKLRDAGIRLRDCTSFGLPGHVRLSVQPPASQDALRKALA